MYGPTPDYAKVVSRRPGHRPRPGGAEAARRLALALALLASVGFGAAHAADRPGPAPVYRTVRVQPGDTLWAIARRRYPADDPRARVDEIERANGLGGPVIRPGQALRVPAT
jgi:nucleoid-associated protein YgaU